ncbi:hypothetical protein DTO271G3_8627 [Paecilomyces variotii]|nr:hypothetical protein DTO271G3_8627 [Paecilomyces variotii]
MSATDDEDLLERLLADIEPSDDDEESADGTRKATLNAAKSLSEIAKALETIADEKELKAWIRSALFRPHWIHYYESYMLPSQRLGIKTRGDDIATIQRVILVAEAAGDRRYMRASPDTSAWTGTDFMAQLMAHLYAENTQDRDGLFWQTSWDREECEVLLWRIIMRVKADHAPSRKEKGWVLIGASEDERAKWRDLMEGQVNKGNAPEHADARGRCENLPSG